MTRTVRQVEISLGDEQASVDRLIESGRFSSEGDVLRAGVRALEREDAALDAELREKIAEALADPRPGVPAVEVFARLRSKQDERRRLRDE